MHDRRVRFGRSDRALLRPSPAREPGDQESVDEQQQRDRQRGVARQSEPVVVDRLRPLVIHLARLHLGLRARDRRLLRRSRVPGALHVALRLLQVGLRLLQRGESLRNALANFAHLRVAVDDGEQERNERETPRALQVEAVDPGEARGEPEQVSGEKDRFARGAAAPLARNEVHRHERKYGEPGPVRPEG